MSLELDSIPINQDAPRSDAFGSNTALGPLGLLNAVRYFPAIAGTDGSPIGTPLW